MSKTCETPGCLDEGMPCYLESGDEEPNGHFCSAHAFGQGFCSCCGMFWSGIESFDFGPGYCEHCASELENTDGEGDEDFEPDHYEEYLP